MTSPKTIEKRPPIISVSATITNPTDPDQVPAVCLIARHPKDKFLAYVIKPGETYKISGMVMHAGLIDLQSFIPHRCDTNHKHHRPRSGARRVPDRQAPEGKE